MKKAIMLLVLFLFTNTAFSYISSPNDAIRALSKRQCINGMTVNENLSDIIKKQKAKDLGWSTENTTVGFLVTRTLVIDNEQREYKWLVLSGDADQIHSKTIHAHKIRFAQESSLTAQTRPVRIVYSSNKKTTEAIPSNELFSISNRDIAKKDLMDKLLKDYKDSYSTVEFLLNAGMKDYGILCSIESNRINDGILRKLKDTYYPSFSTILMLYKANIKSYNRLSE